MLLSGDHILPSITPHISGLDAGPDPLTAFFASLDRMHELERRDRSCSRPTAIRSSDLPQRAKDIRRHHEERLGDAAQRPPRELGEASVEALSQRLFKPRSWGSMAESETYAHLEHLRLAGEADRREAEGSLLYRLT